MRHSLCTEANWGRVPLARTFQIDPGAVMERYNPILLNSIKNQSVSTMKYKEHIRTALSPEYQYFENREGNRRSEVDFCKMISDSQQIASILATQFDIAAIIHIETRRQYVAKASAILDRFGSPFWDVPDDPIRSAGTPHSIARINRIHRIDPANGTRPGV